ncbi:MAG: SRPBCC family protein [Verrucomicrobiota bacterium]
MPFIELETLIAAPIERVFDLARSIDAHVASTKGSNESAVAGRTSGLIELDESVTWEATHFWVKQRLSVRITQFGRPHFFEDEMVRGAFSFMVHRHTFEESLGGTLMKDEFRYSAPFGVLGRLAETFFLTRYMTAFLAGRAAELKAIAESDEWRRYLGNAGDQGEALKPGRSVSQ